MVKVWIVKDAVEEGMRDAGKRRKEGVRVVDVRGGE